MCVEPAGNDLMRLFRFKLFVSLSFAWNLSEFKLLESVTLVICGKCMYAGMDQVWED